MLFGLIAFLLLDGEMVTQDGLVNDMRDIVKNLCLVLLIAGLVSCATIRMFALQKNENPEHGQPATEFIYAATTGVLLVLIDNLVCDLLGLISMFLFIGNLPVVSGLLGAAMMGKLSRTTAHFIACKCGNSRDSIKLWASNAFITGSIVGGIIFLTITSTCLMLEMYAEVLSFSWMKFNAEWGKHATAEMHMNEYIKYICSLIFVGYFTSDIISSVKIVSLDKKITWVQIAVNFIYASTAAAISAEIFAHFLAGMYSSEFISMIVNPLLSGLVGSAVVENLFQFMNCNQTDETKSSGILIVGMFVGLIIFCIAALIAPLDTFIMCVGSNMLIRDIVGGLKKRFKTSQIQETREDNTPTKED